MKFAAFGRVAQLVRAPRLHRGGPGFESLRAHHQTERIFLIGRVAHFAGSESLRLRILEADRNLARSEIPATVKVILLSLAGDVYGLGLQALLVRGFLLSTNRQRDGTNERKAESERRKQASHFKPPGRRITLSNYTSTRRARHRSRFFVGQSLQRPTVSA